MSVKISQLPSSGSISKEDLFALVQSTGTTKLSIDDLSNFLKEDQEIEFELFDLDTIKDELSDFTNPLTKKETLLFKGIIDENETDFEIPGEEGFDGGSAKLIRKTYSGLINDLMIFNFLGSNIRGSIPEEFINAFFNGKSTFEYTISDLVFDDNGDILTFFKLINYNIKALIFGENIQSEFSITYGFFEQFSSDDNGVEGDPFHTLKITEKSFRGSGTSNDFEDIFKINIDSSGNIEEIPVQLTLSLPQFNDSSFASLYVDGDGFVKVNQGPPLEPK